jgi:hypothetical protein
LLASYITEVIAVTNYTEYPLGHVVAVIEPEQFAGVTQSLEASGRWGSGTKTLTGKADALRLDAHGRRGSLLHRVRRWVLQYGAEGEQLAAYERAVAGGRTALAVPVADEGDKWAVARVLRAHKAGLVRYYGRLSVEELSA